MIVKILTGAGVGILTGYTAAVSGGTIQQLLLFFGILLGFLTVVRCKEHPYIQFSALFAVIAARTVMFSSELSIPEIEVLLNGFISGAGYAFCGKESASVISASLSGAAVFALSLLFVSGSGEASLAFICGGVSLLINFFKNEKQRRPAVAALLLLFYSVFPAGNASHNERLQTLVTADKMRGGAVNAMCLPGTGVASRALVVGSIPEPVTDVLKNFPGMERCDTIKHYCKLYPVFKRKENQTTYPVVFCTGNGKMCRLASRMVSDGGVLVIPEKHVSEIPSAFRHWSRLSSAPEFIVLSRDFVIETSGAAIERKMQRHLEKLCQPGVIPGGVMSALCDFPESQEQGIREIDGGKRINYTLWFFGLISGAYLMLRLLIFSRFDKGERRWTALENTASAILLFLLLKRLPDTIFTAVLPAMLFFGLPVCKISGMKWRVLQWLGAGVLIATIFIPELLNVSQVLMAVCCGVMWKNLRMENGAVYEWIDGCSLLGLVLGAAVYAVLLTVNAPVVFVVGLVLLLRSNALFRSL